MVLIAWHEGKRDKTITHQEDSQHQESVPQKLSYEFCGLPGTYKERIIRFSNQMDAQLWKGKKLYGYKILTQKTQAFEYIYIYIYQNYNDDFLH